MPAAIDPLLAAQAIVMSEAGYQGSQIHRTLGIGYASINEIVNRHGRWGDLPEEPVFRKLRSEQQRTLEAAARAMCAKALVQTEAALPKASALQAATVFAICVDKSRIFAGEPTEIHANLNLNAAVSLDKLASILGQRLVETNDDKPNVSADL